jgi:hypothetical protein
MYCSEECQNADWARHKKECAELKQQRKEAKQSRPKATTCASCGKAGATLKCGKCKAVHYCSKECQVYHWKDGLHKQYCGKT